MNILINLIFYILGIITGFLIIKIIKKINNINNVVRKANAIIEENNKRIEKSKKINID